MTGRITINGQHYDNPDEMPPDVRRLYEQAMRTAESSLSGGQSGGSTQVFTSKAGDLGASLVVNRTVIVNDRTYGSVDELPPDVRRLYDDAVKSGNQQTGTAHPKTSFHVSVNFGGSQGRTGADSTRPGSPVPLPVESSHLESDIRRLPLSLAILIGIALVLWAFLGR